MSGPVHKNQKNIKSTKNVDNIEDYDQIGQAKLYSPDYAIKINTKDQLKNSEKKDNYNQNNSSMVGIDDIKNKLGLVKERLMEKLAAASVPSDALENAKILIESTIKDVSSAAQGLTVEALHKIKSHLAHILPALSPSLTSKMVDDAANEMVGEKHNEEHKGKLHTSPASTFYSNSMLLPISKL
ncbi:unnamed protein product [Amaranthus hypochondriacus]